MDLTIMITKQDVEERSRGNTSCEKEKLGRNDSGVHFAKGTAPKFSRHRQAVNGSVKKCHL